MKIAYIYNKNHLDVEGVKAKESPSDYAYGANELIDFGYDVDLIGMDLWYPDYSCNKILMYMSKFVAPLFLNNKLPDQYFIEALRISEYLNTKYDLVVSIPQKMSLALACCKKFGRLDCQVLGIQTGAVNIEDNFYQKKLLAYLYKEIQSIVLGEGESREMKRRYGLTNNQLHFIPFGVDSNFWTPSEREFEKEKMVLSVGSDHYRDFELLIEVAKKMIDVRFVILTNHLIKGSLPSNIYVIKGSTGNPALSFIQLRDLYRSATCVVTPIKDTFQPSGQSSTLQAMACGVPTIIADFKGLWCRKQLENGKTCMMYKTGSVADCTEVIRNMLHGTEQRESIAREARKMVESQASSERFARDLSKIFEQS